MKKKKNDAPFPWQHDSPKRKGGNERSDSWAGW